MCPIDFLIEFVLLIHSSLESSGIELQILRGKMFPLRDTIRVLLNWTLTTICFVGSSLQYTHKKIMTRLDDKNG